MNGIAGWIGAIAIVVGSAGYPQNSAADGFSGADFAAWSPAQQDNYIQIAMTMAGVVLTQTRPEAATCVNDWYFQGNQIGARNNEIRSNVVKHGAHHPAGVIMALIVKACGPVR